MTYDQLYSEIQKKGSFLCVGLDTDIEKVPSCIKEEVKKQGLSESAALFLFNKRIIDATAPYAVAFKLNTAFYEALGAEGFSQMEESVKYIRANYPNIFIIVDAKRGDIGNTARQYAKAFFKRMDCDAVTVSPYMGGDAVLPFLEYEGKWVIVLALTSNVTAEDFETLETSPHATPYGEEDDVVTPLYERVIRQAEKWGNKERIMFVVGATRPGQLNRIRLLSPESFFLVPGVGVQGGNVEDVATAGMNSKCGLLVNSSRGIIFADSSEKFAEAAAAEAARMAMQMKPFLNK